MKNEKSYIYFAKHNSEDLKRVFKVGETSNLEQRQNQLNADEGIKVSRYVSFKGTKDEQLFIEAYLRSKYAGNRNLQHYGLDHFKAYTMNNAKGAENNFFVYVAEAFAILETIKNKKYSYYTYTERYSRRHAWMERINELSED